MSDGSPVPRATYRLQLHKDFRFDDAAGLAPYLARLGISHAYLSPILKSRPGSTHGYDMTDPAEVNPELGGIDGFRRMAAVFREAGIGLILDIVPNHMGIGGSGNPYWLDVLEHGQRSRFAHWFDIDWQSPELGLAGKVLVPFLDRPLADAIADGVLELRRDENGKWAIWVHGHHKLPLAPETYDEASPEPGKEQLAALLGRQHWRLANYTLGDDIINYRRFFMVSDLAGIRIEDDEVFERVHALVFRLIGDGLVDGLRIDHIDGLYDPAAYCRKLRARAPRPIYLIVEKILAEDEKLPAGWSVEGTTGYEFATLVTPLLADPLGETALTVFHRELTGVAQLPAALEHTAKLRVLDHELAAELDSLSRRLAHLAEAERPNGDLTRHTLRQALRAFIAAMPVYRTYLAPSGLAASEKAVLQKALAAARRANPDLAPRAFDFLGALVTGEPASPAGLDLAMRIQQFTGPVMAKGLEDTALYRYNRLLALNDVGERPDRFTRPVGAFHAANLEQARSLPHGMLGTSSHDSKRGEDARCRIVALSGHADAWIAAVAEWVGMLERQHAPEIHADDAYTFFQLLLGVWPPSFNGDLDPGAMEVLADRLARAMQKSLREARLRSHWLGPDAEYEGRVEAFVRAVLDPSSANEMLHSFRRFERRIGLDGALNGLIETTLKLTAPGVPDIYQGAELWEQSLVDPDNRRPIDFDLRRRLMTSADRPLATLLGQWQNGAVKQALIARLLAVRRERPELFSEGSYEPVEIGDERTCAYMRRRGEDALFVAVRLFPWRGDGGSIALPEDGGREWVNLLGESPPGPVRFGELPVMVFGRF